MAYYTKNEVLKYIEDTIQVKKTTAIDFKPFNSHEEVIKSIENQEDIVGFFWTAILSDTNPTPISSGVVFARIDADLYTDDRFAIDMIQAKSENIFVSEVVRNRQKIQENNKKS